LVSFLRRKKMAYHISTPITIDVSAPLDNFDFDITGPAAGTGALAQNFVVSAVGDTLFRASGVPNVLERLPIGTANQLLQVVGGLPSWQTVPLPIPSATNSALVSMSATVAPVPTGNTWQILSNTYVTWDNSTSGNHDAGAMFTVASGVLTIATTGIYQVSAGVRFAGNNTGTGTIAGKIATRQCRLFNTTAAATNPIYLFNDQQANASNTDSTSVLLSAASLLLTAGNTFTLQVRHDAAVALNMTQDVDSTTSTIRSVFLSISRLS
jgi:hypothetical protein